MQLLAVQERRPAGLPRPFAAVFGAPLGPLAVAAATYAAAGAASTALLAAVQGHTTRLGWLAGYATQKLQCGVDPFLFLVVAEHLHGCGLGIGGAAGGGVGDGNPSWLTIRVREQAAQCVLPPASAIAGCCRRRESWTCEHGAGSAANCGAGGSKPALAGRQDVHSDDAGILFRRPGGISMHVPLPCCLSAGWSVQRLPKRATRPRTSSTRLRFHMGLPHSSRFALLVLQVQHGRWRALLSWALNIFGVECAEQHTSSVSASRRSADSGCWHDLLAIGVRCRMGIVRCRRAS